MMGLISLNSPFSNTMGKNKKANKNKKKQNSGNAISSESGGIHVDPARVRFQHSKIRPIFSGCGRSVEGTVEEIRQGRLKPSDLPPIQVIVGPTTSNDEEPWYFSLNNRRLWVLKRCREEGLLPNNQIYVRVRKPKSEQEALRYCLENCALEAKIIPEKSRAERKETKQEMEEVSIEQPKLNGGIEDLISTQNSIKVEEEEEEESESESSDDDSVAAPVSNRFSALF